MLNFAFSGTEVLLGMGLVVLLIIGLIRWGNHYFQHHADDTNAGGSRTKYLRADIFRHRPVFLKLGLVCSLAFVFLAFNFTQFEARALPGIVSIDGGETIIETTTPITFHPPPPPPPLPKIQAVDDPEIIDTTTFRSMDIGSKEPIGPPAIAKPSKPKFVPPPPPIPADDASPRRFVENMPVFGDCLGEADKSLRKTCSDRAIINFINKHVRYPAFAAENEVQGTAVIRFIVEKDGSLTEIEIVRDPGAGLGKEAARVVELMATTGPKWTPGNQQGRPVRVLFNLPVKFLLE